METIEDDEKSQNFFLRHRIKWVTGAVVLAGAGAFLLSSRETRPIRQTQTVRVLAITPPQPPPLARPELPRPKDETPPTPQEMVMQEPVESKEVAPDEASAKVPSEVPGPTGEAMGTNIQGDGSANPFGLTGRGGGGMIGGSGGSGVGGRGGSRWGWYASRVQRSLEEALRKNTKTSTSQLTVEVRAWLDASGRIERTQLMRSTGDLEIDEILKSEILRNLRVGEPPPPDMPQPIVMRITALHP